MKKNSLSILIYVAAVILAAVVVISVAATTGTDTAATSFKDVPADAYYAEAAERMADRGILSGFGDGYYYGDQTVTRAQIAALVCKMLGKADEATSLAGKTAFVDVPETNWSTGYVNYAVANGIISGDGDGNFRPDDPVKYEEVVKVIVCVLGLDENVKIDPNDWSKEFIEAADAAGLLGNLTGKKGEYMKRSDIAVICDAAMTVLDNVAEETAATTTTKKPSSSGTPSVTTAVTTPKVTTEATTRPAVTAPPIETEPVATEEDYYTTGPDELPGI